MQLLHSIPDFERRATIIMLGPTAQTFNWVGCCDYNCGAFDRLHLDIPARIIWSHYVFINFTSLKALRSQSTKQFEMFLTL
jgi:hypothetical protein